MSFQDRTKGSTLAVVQVVRSERISPNIVRVTVGGEQLAPMPHHGFDQWFRLFLPREEGETSFNLPNRADLVGYLKFLRMPEATRPHLRNYTVREFRPEQLELDIDFVVHGDEGIATRWATRTQPGDTVALLDQGQGFDHDPTAEHQLLVADETGLPAVLGILRDLPRDARGTAFIEIPHADDAQQTAAPDGFEVRWLVRDEGVRPGIPALEAVKGWTPPTTSLRAYIVGEQALPTGARRWLVNELGVPKKAIQFVGYWRMGHSH
jgi:NADPH-dependent ferric siderophore reductase